MKKTLKTTKQIPASKTNTSVLVSNGSRVGKTRFGAHLLRAVLPSHTFVTVEDVHETLDDLPNSESFFSDEIIDAMKFATSNPSIVDLGSSGTETLLGALETNTNLLHPVDHIFFFASRDGCEVDTVILEALSNAGYANKIRLVFNKIEGRDIKRITRINKELLRNAVELGISTDTSLHIRYFELYKELENDNVTTTQMLKDPSKYTCGGFAAYVESRLQAIKDVINESK